VTKILPEKNQTNANYSHKWAINWDIVRLECLGMFYRIFDAVMMLIYATLFRKECCIIFIDIGEHLSHTHTHTSIRTYTQKRQKKKCNSIHIMNSFHEKRVLYTYKII